MRVKRVKRLLAFVISGSMVFNAAPILPHNVYATEVREAVLAKIPHAQMAATANTQMSSASGNDGPAAWAIDDNEDGTANTTSLWHARYSGTPATGEVPIKQMPQTITLDLNSATEESSTQSYMVKQIDITNRSGGDNRIGNYELQIANAVNPTDQDFVTVAKGTFTELNSNSIVLPIAVEATHVRIVGKNSIGGTPNLVVIANIEVQEDTTASKENNADVVGITYHSGSETYFIEGVSQDITTYELFLPYGVTIADITSKCITSAANATVTNEVVDGEGRKTCTYTVSNGTANRTYTVVYKESSREIPQTQFSATANTEQLPAGYINDGGAEWAINGNLENWWHARYQGTAGENEIQMKTFPQELTVNLDKNQENALYLVNGVKITTRGNGYCTLKNFKILVSKDGTNFTEVLAKENFASNIANTLIFDEAVLAKYIRLQILAVNGNGGDTLCSNVADFRAYEEPNIVTADVGIIGDAAQGTVAVDRPICKPDTAVTFTATANLGYRFLGWYNNQNGDGTAVSTEANYTTTISENTTLYAKYEVVQECNLVASVVTGTTQGTAEVNTAIVSAGENATFTATVTDSNYEFVGWYNNADGSGDAVSTDNPYTAAMLGDLTLYAKFQKKPLVVATEALQEVYDECTPYNQIGEAYTDTTYQAFKSAYDTAAGLLGAPTTVTAMNEAKTALETTRDQLVFYKEFIVNGASQDISNYALGIKKLKNYTISFVFQLDETIKGTNQNITLLSLQNASGTEKMNFYVNPKASDTKGLTGITNYRNASDPSFRFTNLENSAITDTRWHTVTFQSSGSSFETKIDGQEKTFSADGNISGKDWVQDVTKAIIGDGIGNVDFKGKIQRVIISGEGDDTIDTKPVTEEEKATYNTTLAYLESVPEESRTEDLINAISAAKAAVTGTSTLAAVNNATLDMEVEKANIFETIFKYGVGDNDKFVVRASNSKNAIVPSEPTKSGYTFKGWFTAEYGDTNAGVTEVTDYTQAQTVYAQWDKNYAVSVSGGTIVGNVVDPTSGNFISNTKVELLANAPADGMKFAGWYANNELVGTNNTFIYYVTKDMNFEARFVSTSDSTNVQMEKGVRLDDALLMNSYVDITKTNIRFYGQVNMVQDKTPIEAGIVWTTDAEAGKNLQIGAANVRKAAAKNISNIGQFSITITGAPIDVTMYARMYVKYADGTNYYYSIKQGNIESGVSSIVTAPTESVQ